MINIIKSSNEKQKHILSLTIFQKLMRLIAIPSPLQFSARFIDIRPKMYIFLTRSSMSNYNAGFRLFEEVCRTLWQPP